MKLLLKEDGGRLLLEDGGAIVLSRTTFSPGTVIPGYTFDIYVTSEEGGFDGTTIVSVSGTGITVTNIMVTSATELYFRITVDAGATLSARDVTITTGASVETNEAVLTVAAAAAETTFRQGFQYTLLVRGEDIRRTPGVTIDKSLGGVHRARFTIDGQSNQPIEGEKIEIVDSFDGDRRLFGGMINRSNMRYEGQTDQLAWDVECVDFTFLMNRLRPIGVWVNMSVSDIVKDLIARWAPGFTTNHVQTKLAKVTLIADGSKDLLTILKELGGAIGGGHVYVDYDQDVHFFHVVPPSLMVPTTATPSFSSWMTVADGGPIPTADTYTPGYYLLHHTFIYSDGTESSLQACSNMFVTNGTRVVSISGLPLGSPVAGRAVIARRLYARRLGVKFVESSFSTTLWATGSTFPVALQGESLDNIIPLCQVNDNTTTAFTCYMGVAGASASVVEAIPSGTTVPQLSSAIHLPGPTTAPSPRRIFAGYNELLWGGTYSKARVAFIYRDGTISFAGLPSGAFGSRGLVRGILNIADEYRDIPIGPTVDGLDCVARLIYRSDAELTDPNYSESGPFILGHISGPFSSSGQSITFKEEPDLSAAHTHIVAVVPDNTTTSVLTTDSPDLLSYQLTPASGSGVTTAPSFADAQAGAGSTDPRTIRAELGSKNYYPNPNEVALSVDPIPLWPNEDGPWLEDDSTPEDVTDDSDLLLHQDSGTGVQVDIDISQIRNRVDVVGAGSVSLDTTNVGDSKIRVNEITSFSPTGGTIRVIDVAAGIIQELEYSGVTGVPGETYVQLLAPLKKRVSQGAVINNFFRAEDVDSQRLMGEVERDKDGNKTDGIHQYTITDGTLKARFQLYMRAFAELELYSRPIITVSYSTRDPLTDVGKIVHVDLSNPPVQGDFLIQSITIDQIHDESDQLSPRYTVKASSVRYELTDLLLQILGNQSVGGGVSAAGIAATAVVQSTDSAEATGDAAERPPTRMWGARNVSSAGLILTEWGLASLTEGGAGTGTQSALSAGSDTDHAPWRRFSCTTNPGAGLAFCGGLLNTGSNPGSRISLDPYMEAIIRTGPNLDDFQIHVALGLNGITQAFSDGTLRGSSTAREAFGVLYSATSLANTGLSWRPFYHDAGGSLVTGDSILTVAANTIYRVRLSVSNSVLTATVNGVSKSLALPWNNTKDTAFLPCVAGSGSVTGKILDFNSYYVSQKCVPTLPD